MALPPPKCGEMEAFYRILGPLELSAAERDIYGPAHAVKGLSNGKHASEQMQPYIRIWTPLGLQAKNDDER